MAPASSRARARSKARRYWAIAVPDRSSDRAASAARASSCRIASSGVVVCCFVPHAPIPSVANSTNGRGRRVGSRKLDGLWAALYGRSVQEAVISAMTLVANALNIAILAVPDVAASTLFGMVDLFASAGRDWAFFLSGIEGE